MATQPDLGITDPYQLNQEQFDAAIALLEAQAANDPLYWSSYTEQMASYTAGDVVVGTTWPLQVALLQGNDPPVPVEGVKPDEGTTGWSDTWMLAKDAAHPNCMKLWMNHMMSPEANAQATVWFGEAATSPQACEAAEALSPGHCEAQHADDEAYWENIYYWARPRKTAPMTTRPPRARPRMTGSRPGPRSPAAEPLAETGNLRAPRRMPRSPFDLQLDCR